MKRSCFIMAIALVLLALSTPYSLALSPEESFKKNFPGKAVDVIKPTVIAGVYEVVSDNEVFYYAPAAEVLIYGELIKKDGLNLTLETRKSILGEKVKALPLAQAVKVGHGLQTVIAVIDPDCPFCRRAFEFFKQGKDVTQYVYFLPLPMHREAESKVKYVLCAKDKETAYTDVMSGKLDGKKLDQCPDGTAENLLKIHGEVSKKLGVDSVPFFYINGQPIVGADLPAIENLLGGGK